MSKKFSDSKLYLIDMSSAEELAIADKIKETSKKAIATLQERGIEVYMLTGDNNKTASAVAHQVGISNYKGEVLPSDKAAFVEKIVGRLKAAAQYISFNCSRR